MRDLHQPVSKLMVFYRLFDPLMVPCGELALSADVAEHWQKVNTSKVPLGTPVQLG